MPQRTIKSVGYILKHKAKKGIDYRTLAEKTKKSHAYWWVLLVRDKRTPTIQNAIQIASALELSEEERKTILNLVFKERLIDYLEDQGFAKLAPTEEIRKLLEILEHWTPEKGSPVGYIMSTFCGSFNGAGLQLLFDSAALAGSREGESKNCLTARGIEGNFREGLGVELADCCNKFGCLKI